MNDAISELGKRGKRKSKIEQLLLVDHSDIYFENEKLAERLAKYLDELYKDSNRQKMQRNIEIQELKKEIASLQAMKESSTEQTKKFLQSLEKIAGKSAIPKPPKTETEKKIRPHTTGSYFKRSRNKSEERPPAAERPQTQYRARSASDHDDSDKERLQKRGKRSKENTEDINTYTEGGKKNQKLKYPKEWYTTVLQASDACLKKIRQEYRRQQTAPVLSRQAREQTEDKPKTSQGTRDQGQEHSENMNRRSNINTSYGARQTVSRKSSVATQDSQTTEEMESKSRIKLLCQRKAKPVLMSLRQMKELTGMEGNQDNLPNKRQEKLNRQIHQTEKQFLTLSERVKTFIKEIDAKIAQDIEDTKEKEKDTFTDSFYDGILPPDQLPP